MPYYNFNRDPKRDFNFDNHPCGYAFVTLKLGLDLQASLTEQHKESKVQRLCSGYLGSQALNHNSKAGTWMQESGLPPGELASTASDWHPKRAPNSSFFVSRPLSPNQQRKC